MRAIARFAFNIGDQPLGRQGREDPLVIDFDDIDLLFVKHLGDIIERARPILQPDAEPRQASVACQIAEQHISQ